MLRPIFSFLSILFLLLLGASIGLFIATQQGFCTFSNISPYHWAIAGTCAFFFLFLCNLMKYKKEKKEEEKEVKKNGSNQHQLHEESMHVREDFERLKREVRQSFKAFLKVSVLFWIAQYKKERAKSSEEAKKELFKELKKEFSQVFWMDEIVDMVREDISRYYKDNQKGNGNSSEI